MKNAFRKLCADIALNDSEILSYAFNQTQSSLILNIERWNGDISSFMFTDVISFIDKFENEPVELYVGEDISLIPKSLLDNFDQYDIREGYKIYIFCSRIDFEDTFSIFIIAKNLQLLDPKDI